MTLGEWDGTNWIGGTPNIYNDTVIATSTSIVSKYVSTLGAGKRYRYTIKYIDVAGNESAYTWREFVTKKKVGEIHYGDKSSGVFAIPIYDPNSGVAGPKSVRIGDRNSLAACFELVSITDPNATPFRVATNQGVMAISK